MKLFRLSFPFLLLAGATALNASPVSLITINTSGIPAGTQGNLDFLFNTGGTPAGAAFASITNFTTTGTLTTSSFSATNATGTLPGPVSLINNNAEYLQAIRYGSTISFNLQFSGPAVDSPTGSGFGSTFTLSLLNSTLDGSFLTSNINDGYILEFNISANGQTTPTTFTTSTGASSVVSIQTLPEPGAWALSGGGLMVLILLRRKQL